MLNINFNPVIWKIQYFFLDSKNAATYLADYSSLTEAKRNKISNTDFDLIH